MFLLFFIIFEYLLWFFIIFWYVLQCFSMFLYFLLCFAMLLLCSAMFCYVFGMFCCVFVMFLVCSAMFPNRSLLLRVLISHQRRVHRNTQQGCLGPGGRPAPAAVTVWFSIGFLPKSPKTSTVLNTAKICNGKYKGLELLSQKQYTFENSIVLHKEVKNNTLLKTALFYTRKSKTIHFWKQYCFTQGSQKQYTFENSIVLHKEVKNKTLLKTLLFYTRKSKTIHFWKPYCFTQGSHKHTETHRNKQKPTEKHTETNKHTPGPPPRWPFDFRSGFYLKVQKQVPF